VEIPSSEGVCGVLGCFLDDLGFWIFLELLLTSRGRVRKGERKGKCTSLGLRSGHCVLLGLLNEEFSFGL